MTTRLHRFASSRAAIIVVFAVALAARTTYAVWFELDGLYTGFSHLVEDERSYEWMVDNLLEHGQLGYRGEPSARRGPGYPLFLAVFYGLVGKQYALVRGVQFLIDASAACLVMLTLGLYGRRLAGFLSGLTYALYPVFVYNAAELLSEALVLPLFVATTYLLARYLSTTGRLWLPLVAGAAVGAMYLVRESNILLPIPLAAVLWFSARRLRPTTARRATVAFVVGFTLLWSPWVIRNYAVFGELGATGTSGGENLLRGANMAVHGVEIDKQWTSFRRDNGLLIYQDFHDPAKTGQSFPDEWESDRKAKRMAWQTIREHPGDFARFGLEKLGASVLYTDPHRERARQPGMRSLLAWVYRALAVVGVWGIVLAWRRRMVVLLAIHGVHVATGLFVIFMTQLMVRYRYVTLDLAFVTFAGLALAALIGRGAPDEAQNSG